MFVRTHRRGFVRVLYREFDGRLTQDTLVGVTLFIFLTLIVRVILSPVLSVLFVAATYSLIWLPQILRSARRGRSSGLSVEYVVGVTVCRLYGALCK